MNIKRSYPVFITDGGDHFVFPGLYDSPDEDQFVTWDVPFTWTLALGVTRSETDLVVEFEEGSEEAQIAHVRVSVGHPAFANGSEDVLLVSGPLFEKSFKEKNNQ